MHRLTTTTLLCLVGALALLACLVAALIVLWLRPSPQTTPMVFYASSTGSGTACTETAPCRVADVWPRVTPGSTVLLLDGTYRRSQGGAIDPPDTLAGTASQPITVKALNDGKVLIDAEQGIGVYLAPTNHYWHIWGINAKNGGENVFRVRGDHNRFYRVIGWDGTAGMDTNVFSYEGEDTIFIDVAGWGVNIRKIFSGSQATGTGQNMQGSGCRRCWGEWNDHPMGVSSPSTTYQIGYRSRQQRFENILGTVRFLGDVRNFEGLISAFYDCPASDLTMTDTTVLGALMYLQNGESYGSQALNTSLCTKNMVWRDLVAFLDTSYTAVAPLRFLNETSSPDTETNNVCENCLAVHAGTPVINQVGSGWTTPGLRQGHGLAEATGGSSAFTFVPGMCYRYEAGVLTQTPLWPWPMNDRIKAARKASGAPEVDVTQTVEALLGPIPPHCKTTTPVPPDPQPPTVAMTCTGTLSAVPGTVQMQCVPQTTRR